MEGLDDAADLDVQPVDTMVLGGTEMILVADDHEGVRDTTRQILEKL